jgi:hypothetical protein
LKRVACILPNKYYSAVLNNILNVRLHNLGKIKIAFSIILIKIAFSILLIKIAFSMLLIKHHAIKS